METFTNVEDAFKWFLENIYKNLSPDQKKGKLTTAWRNFTHSGSISEKKMLEILNEFGDVEIRTIVRFKPK